MRKSFREWTSMRSRKLANKITSKTPPRDKENTIQKNAALIRSKEKLKNEKL